MVELGDGVKGMLSQPKGSAAAVITDLPSGETEAKFDIALDLPAFFDSAWHALKPNGPIIVMASSLRFAAKLIATQEKYFRHDLIWSKSLATGHLNAKRSPLRAHEYILVFARIPPTYNPQFTQGASPIHAARRFSHGENYGPQTQANESRAGATDRFPVSVLEFASVGTSSKKGVHPQQKPVPLLQWLVRTYSNPGDLIIDPCAGSGSTGVAAELEGRTFRGWDLSPRFGLEPPAEGE